METAVTNFSNCLTRVTRIREIRDLNPNFRSPVLARFLWFCLFIRLKKKARSLNHCCLGRAVGITYSVCVRVYSCLSHPAFKYHIFCIILYRHLLPVKLHHIFPHYLINGTVFEKKLLNIKCVFWFSLQMLSETFLILRRIHGDIIINVHRSSCKVPVMHDRF